MRKHFLKDLFFATVLFESEGGNSQIFLSECMEHFLKITDIRSTPYGFQARIPARQYRKLHAPARAARCKLHVVKKYGLWFHSRSIRRHYGVGIGLLLVVLVAFFFRNQLWDIEYYGVNSATAQMLSDQLFTCGIYQGCFVKDEDLRDATQQILIKTDQFAALSLNYAKGKLVVEAQMSKKNPDLFELQDWDILACDNGVVRSVEVYNGVAAVQPGQTVKKGDVLVKATWAKQDGALESAPCRARIMAYIEKTTSTACPLTQKTNVAVGTYTESLALCVGKQKIWLKKAEEPQGVPFQKGVQIFGLSLPLTIYGTLGTITQEETLTLTVDEAQRQCVETLNAVLYAQFPEMQVLSRDYTFEMVENTVQCTLQLRAYADIANASSEKE